MRRQRKGEMRNCWPIYLSEGWINIPSSDTPSLCSDGVSSRGSCRRRPSAGHQYSSRLCLLWCRQENNFILILQINSWTLLNDPAWLAELLQCSELHMQRMALVNIPPPNFTCSVSHKKFYSCGSFRWNWKNGPLPNSTEALWMCQTCVQTETNESVGGGAEHIYYTSCYNAI